MATGYQVQDSNDEREDDNLTFDWEDCETLQIVRAFPISDYGTKSDYQSSTNDFLVPEPPSLSGIIDSTISNPPQRTLSDVDENYIEDDMSSLTDVSSIKVSDAPRKHRYAKERVERKGNIYDKFYNACLKGDLSTIKDILKMHSTLMQDKDGQTPLYAACIGDHREIVKLLTDLGYDVNHQDKDGNTPLHIIFENHATDLAQTAVDQFKASTEIRNKQNWTPLHTAIDRGYFSYSKELSAKCLHQDVGTEVSWIQLHAACWEENTHDVELLMAANTDVNHINSAGYAALHIAVTKGNIDIVTLLLDQDVHVNCVTIDGKTPLHIAADKGEESIIQKLLTQKADPNMKDVLGNTSLHMAVRVKQEIKPWRVRVRTSYTRPSQTPYRACSLQTVQAIIDHGASVNAVNNRGQTALWFASVDGQESFVKFLLDTGADPNITDKYGESCLYAALHGHCNAATLQEMLAHGAHVNTLNKDGATPLLLACSTAQADAVMLLLEERADPNIAYADGDASLHAAIAADCSKETIQEIIDHGADVNAVNSRGRTALLLGCFYRQMDSVKVLLEAGADPSVADKEGFSCLHAAIDGHCSKDTLQGLIDHGIHIDATRKDGTNAFLRACSTGQSESVMFLIEAGADVIITKPDANTCLHLAVKGECSNESLQKIIEQGKIDVNAVNKRNETALLLACVSAQAESVKLLLRTGSDPNISDASGYTSLHAAVYGCCTSNTLQEIIAHEVLLDAQNIYGRTALWLACSYRQQDSVILLLEAGSNPNTANGDGDTCLHAAITGGCSKKIIHKIIDHGANVNTTNMRNETVLTLACLYKNEGAINVLLKANADPNITENTYGDISLHKAVSQECSKEVLQALIDHGANVNATNKRNETALTLACLFENEGAIILLVNASADPNIAVEAYGYTCLHDAITGDWSKEVLQALIDHGANVNVTNKRNETALQQACLYKNEGAINALLNSNADPNIADEAYGDTCLHKAVSEDCGKEVLQALIDHGANVNAANKRNETALTLAWLYKNEGAINVLLNSNADPNIADEAYGNTCLHNAVSEQCSKEVLQALIDHGANVNATNKRTETALQQACLYNNEGAINVLLNSNADPNIADEDGDTCLHDAVIDPGDCSKEMLQAVISHGAHVNATNKRNVTPLMKACQYGNLDVINVLLSAAADIEMTDDFGRQCLHFVFYSGKHSSQSDIDHCTDVREAKITKHAVLVLGKSTLYAVSVLIKAQTDPHIPVYKHICEQLLQDVTNLGANLLVVKDGHESAAAQCLFCNSRQRESMNMLLRVGADITNVDVFGDTCLHKLLHREYLSLEYDHETLQMFLDHSVPVNATNKNHQTAYMLACGQGNIDAMCALLKAGADHKIICEDNDASLQRTYAGSSSKVTLQTIKQWLDPTWHYLDVPTLEITESLSFNLVSLIVKNMMRHAICSKR